MLLVMFHCSPIYASLRCPLQRDACSFGQMHGPESKWSEKQWNDMGVLYITCLCVGAWDWGRNWDGPCAHHVVWTQWFPQGFPMKAGEIGVTPGWLLHHGCFRLIGPGWTWYNLMIFPMPHLCQELWLEFPSFHEFPPQRLIWCTLKDSRTASNRQQLSDILSTSLVWHIEVNPYKAVLTRQSSYLQCGNS